MDILKRLRMIPHPPKTLHHKGILPDLNGPLLAVIGSRAASSEGIAITDALIRRLAGTSVCIVSGLARGIDTAAHESALRYQLPTIAVLGSGWDTSVLYPKENSALAARICAAGGCLISEYSPKTPAAPRHFIARNRLIAGLADAVLVIEAHTRSGSLITARMALDYNKDVFAVPGSILSGSHEGAHQLIMQGATPVTSGTQLRSLLGID